MLVGENWQSHFGVHILRQHEILVDGKLYKVKLETSSIGVPFSVRVNEKNVEVKIDGEPSYKDPFTVSVQGKSYEVELSRIDRKSPFPVRVNEVPFIVQFKTAERKAARILTPSAPVLSSKPSRKVVKEGEILAPMAGKIVSVKVKKSDRVKNSRSTL